MTNTTVEIKGPSTSVGGLIRKGLANMGPLLILLILEGILLVMSPPYRSATSHMLLALEVATIGVVAAGQTFVILTGGIDLSVEAMVSFAGVTLLDASNIPDQSWGQRTCTSGLAMPKRILKILAEMTGTGP